MPGTTLFSPVVTSYLYPYKGFCQKKGTILDLVSVWQHQLTSRGQNRGDFSRRVLRDRLHGGLINCQNSLGGHHIAWPRDGTSISHLLSSLVFPARSATNSQTQCGLLRGVFGRWPMLQYGRHQICRRSLLVSSTQSRRYPSVKLYSYATKKQLRVLPKCV